jgi:hypothetical protein
MLKPHTTTTSQKQKRMLTVRKITINDIRY